MNTSYASKICIWMFLVTVMLVSRAANADGVGIPISVRSLPSESKVEADRRHERVRQRRAGIQVICHRGALEFAHENTLEAYRATLELGADGNEIDIRRTRDGVLVCFHDDMLDRLLEGYGTVHETTWEDLCKMPFREPGRYAEHCRIPTLVEVLELHRRHAGLLHLDIKQQGLDDAIAELLEQMDMWDHVAFCNSTTAPKLAKHAKLVHSRYKGGLYEDHGEVDPAAIESILAREGNALILEDPRGTLIALGRPLGNVSKDPVSNIPGPSKRSVSASAIEIEQALVALRDDSDWDDVAETPADRGKSARRILNRAEAAELILRAGVQSEEAFELLRRREQHRSLHKEWMYHGLDGAMAMRALIGLGAPQAVAAARESLWRDDPILSKVQNPEFKTPRSWTDFRFKMVILPALAKLPGAATEKLCRDYLALPDEKARELGPPQFDEAARTLLTISPTTVTARDLMRHRLAVVRGRAVLMCLSSAKEPWALEALRLEMPHALAYRVAD